MQRILVFAAAVPATLDSPAAPAGLRAAQVIQALRDGGHDVSVSVPGPASWTMPGTSPGPVQVTGASPDGQGGLRHSPRTALDVLRRVRPDVVVWMDPLLRCTPASLMAGPLQVCDLHGHAPDDPAARDRMARHAAGADLLLTASGAQDGFWLAALPPGPACPTVIVPYAAPPGLRLPHKGGVSPLRRLHVPGGLHLRPGGLDWLKRAAAWCGTRGIALHVDPAAGETPDLAALRTLHGIEAMPGVHLSVDPALRQTLDGYGPGSLVLDLADDLMARRLDAPAPVLDALAHGVPLLTNAGGDLAQRLVHAGAAVTLPLDAAADAAVDGDALDDALDGLAALPAAELGAMAAAARDCAARWFDPADAANALLDALDRAGHARTGRRSAWGAHRPPPDRLPQVLVLSEQGDNMRGVRVDTPLGKLHEEGRVAGYAVWRKGKLGFSTRPAEADPAFDAIWVQRDLPPDLAMALTALGRPYLLDMDDNVLVSPAYRVPFSVAQLQASRSLVRGCAVLTTSGDRLAGLLQHYAGATLLDRTVVCRNLAAEQPPFVPPGPPTCLVWASSDAPALTGGYLGTVRAVRDFCLAYGVRLVCIGAPPPGLAVEAGVATEHLGMMPYHAYLAHLRSLAPAILVAPLDTGADPATQDFIDGKSDIKVLESLVTGLVGVFSDAPAYRDTDLPAPILCRNDHPGWLAGLERARQLCMTGTPRQALPRDRMASGPGLHAWDEALRRARLRHPLRLSEVEQAVKLNRTTVMRRLLPSEEFDATWYVSVNQDVGMAVAAGQITAYAHYSNHGYFEGRPGNQDELMREDKVGFWGNVMNTLGDVRAGLDVRAAALEAMQSRRRRRQAAGFTRS